MDICSLWGLSVEISCGAVSEDDGISQRISCGSVSDGISPRITDPREPINESPHRDAVFGKQESRN